MTNEKPRIEIPKTFMGISTEEAYKRVLEGNPTEPETPIQTSSGRANIEGMIYVPEAEIYFAKQRTHLGEDWNKTHLSLASEGVRMPTIEEFRKSLKYFKSSQDRELQALYNEITQIREPWRANWLDAYFEKRKDGLYVLTGNKTKPEKLEDCLMEDKTPGINLEQWTSGKNTTSQGIPKSTIKTDSKGLYYWHPRDGNVAGFDAYSGRADIDCDWYPSSWSPVLGVFGVVNGGS